MSPARLELEITEGVLIGDFTARSSILRRLKNLGVRIAMDDFGTGYSSLSYLQSFPFDKIKIDQAFVANLAHSQQAATIIRAVIALGRGLNLPVVAEGVETEEQRAFLAAEQLQRDPGLSGRTAEADRRLRRGGRARAAFAPENDAGGDRIICHISEINGSARGPCGSDQRLALLAGHNNPAKILKITQTRGGCCGDNFSFGPPAGACDRRLVRNWHDICRAPRTRGP